MAAGQQVVVVPQARILNVENKAAEPASHGDENSLGSAGRDLDLRRYRVGAILDVNGGEEVDGGAAGAVDVVMAAATRPGPGAASAGERRLKRQNVVARGFDPPELLQLAELVRPFRGQILAFGQVFGDLV